MPLRICFPFLGRWFGGSHQCTLEILKHIDGEGFAPQVIFHEDGLAAEAFAAAGRSYEVCAPQGHPVTPSRLRNGAWALSRLPAAVSFLRRRGIDLVHVGESPAAELWALAARMARLPALWHVHSPAIFGISILPRLASHYVCVSNYVLELLPARLRPFASAIPNGFSPPPVIRRSQERARVLAELGIPDDAAIIGYCGRLSGVKRPDLFIEAAAQIDGAFPGKSAFVLIGDERAGTLQSLRRLAEAKGLRQKVFFPGFQREPLRWMAAFDILLVTAEREAFGRIIVEAAQVGTPTIATDVGGHREAIEDGRTGFLVPADDPGALAARTVKLLGDPHRRAHVAAAAQAATRRYDAAAIAGRFEDLYRRLSR